MLTKGLTLATTTMMLNSDAITSSFSTSAATGLNPLTPTYNYWDATQIQLQPYQRAAITSEDFTENS